MLVRCGEKGTLREKKPQNSSSQIASHSASEMHDCCEHPLVPLVPSEVRVKVKVTQPCLTLWDPMDYTAHGILQARILEWVAFPFSRGSFQPRDRTQVSRIAGGFFTS